jgi:large repetitive protein
MYYLRCLFFFSLCIGSMYGYAQKIDITVKSVSTAINNESGQDEYGWNVSALGRPPFCINRNGEPSSYPVNQKLIFNVPITNLADDVALTLEGWEEDDCESSCSFDRCGSGDDDEHCTYNTTFKPIDYPPGVTHALSLACEWKYGANFEFIYTPPVPALTIMHKGTAYANAQLCDNETITIQPTSSIDVWKSQLQYVWEYNVNGNTRTAYDRNPEYCGDSPVCDGGGGPLPIALKGDQFVNPSFAAPQAALPGDGGPPPDCCFKDPYIERQEIDWRSLKTTLGNDVNSGNLVLLVRNIPEFTNLTENATIYFRVKIVANGTSGDYTGAPYIIKVSPLPPTTNAVPTTEASCPSSGTGKIFVTGVSHPNGAYRYLLKLGYPAAISDCAPNINPADCLKLGEKSDKIIDGSNSFEIPNVAVGVYSLFLTNIGGTQGVCPSPPIRVEVTAIPNLTVSPQSDIAMTCYGDSRDVSFTISNGRPSSTTNKDVNYKLFNGSGTLVDEKNTNTAGATVTFLSLSAGSYRMSATDFCTPSVERNFVITQPIKVNMATSDFSFGNATCNVPGNGQINATVTKSKPSSTNYHFRILKDGNAAPFREVKQASGIWLVNDLPVSDNYQLIVTEDGSPDCNGVTKNFQIKPPADLGATIQSITEARCFDSADGTISVNGTGGSLQYGYELKETSTGTSFNNATGNFTKLLKGDYELTVKNSLPGCLDKYVMPSLITVGGRDSLKIELTKKDITCNGARNGEITAAVSGGRPGYNYVWEVNLGSTWSSVGTNSPTLTGLIEGQYRVRVTDTGPCERTSGRISIKEPAVLGITSVKVNDIACLGDKGTIQITPTGGTAPYTFAYSVNSGGTFIPFDETTPLLANDYRVKVTDANGCAFTDLATHKITDPPSALDFTFAQKLYGTYNISCFGGNNGEITLTASGGNGGSYAGYQYAWDGGSFGTNNIVSGITAGDKQISVRDARGCVVSKTIPFIQAPPIATLTSAKRDVECFGAATGSIQLSTSGGVGSFKFKLGTATNTNGLFENLTAGNYSFTITDGNNCGVVYNETIINLHPALTAIPSVQDVSCFGGTNGKVTLTMGGGVSPYQVKQGNNAVVNPIINLAKGTYDFTITDGKGCTLPLTGIVVNQPDLLQIDKTILKDIECFGGTGTIDILAKGGTKPYVLEYSTNNGGLFVTFDNTTALSVGSYLVRVNDAKNCTAQATQPVLVTAPASPLDFTFTKSDYNGYNISCFSGTNGFALITPTGGNGATYSGYQFSIDGKPYQTADKVEGIDAGDHLLSVKDARGCVVSKNTNFTESPVPISTSVVRTKDVTCFNETNGEIEMTADGGTAPYQFQIPTRSFQDDVVIRQLGVGSYVITAKDKNGCKAQASTSIVSLNPAITTLTNITDVSCYAGTDGSIEMIVGGGVTPFSYQWKDIANTLSESSQKLSNLKIGQYTVKVTDKAGCKVEIASTIKQPEAPLSVSLTSLPACWDQGNGTVAAIAKGGTSPYQFAIDNSTYGTSPSFQKGTGSHTVNVRDAKGCLTDAKIAVEQRNLQPKYNFLAASKQYALDTLVLSDISVPKPDSIQWAFDPRANIIDKDQWSPRIKFSAEGVYWVEMKASFGSCTYALRKNLDLKPYDPNAKPSKLNGYRTISSIDASPNPSNGEFDLTIKLSTKSKVTVTIFDVLGVVHFNNTYEPSMEINTRIILPNVSAGIYVLRATAETDAKDVRLSINK